MVDLLDAIQFAVDRHRDQRRKGAQATPYINHPIAVANCLAKSGHEDDLAVLLAAILHDTVEDTQTTADEIAERFGREVTDDKTLTKAQRKQAQVDHAPSMSRGAALVKLADKTCNLRNVANAPPVGWSLVRRQEYFDWAKLVVDRLPDVSERMRNAFAKTFAKRPS
jgi:guanosine-3',5'-bis(diphosphate) 3'-pyrophosphohydrolase